MECVNCQFLHQYPFPDIDYSKEYFEKIKPDFKKEHEIDKQWFSKIVYKDIFDTIETYIDSKQRRILDVGAGMLGFCQFAVKRGWDAVGLDPSLQAYQQAQKLKIDFYRGNYDENSIHLGIFDVIHAYETLEHINKPVEFLTQSHKQLEQKGILVLTVPNDFNKLQNSQNKHKSKKTHWITKEHINYFTIESLENLLKNNGFDILETRTNFPMEMFLFMGIDYTKNARTGRRVHGYRKRWELNLEKSGLSSLRKDFNQFWTDRNLGRDITIIARKV